MQALKRVLFLKDVDPTANTAILDALYSHGCEVESVYRHRLDPQSGGIDIRHFHLVLSYGPNTGSMLPAAELFLALPPQEPRPLFAWWIFENMPSSKSPVWAVDLAAHLRVRTDRWLQRSGPVQRLLTQLGLRETLLKGHRLRMLGELNWLRSHGIPDVLAVSGQQRCQFLQQRGFPATPVEFGYHPSFGTDLHLKRDVDVFFLGRSGSGRRQRLLQHISRELERRNIRLTVFSKTDPPLYGEERTHYLNRCKIFLNVLKAGHDNVAYRLLLGAANKALVVSEPLSASAGFQPGRHFVVSPIEEMADTIEYYLHHEEKRYAITDEAYRYVTQDLTMDRMIGRILDRCRAFPHATQTAQKR